MQATLTEKKLVLVGEVIETIEKDGKRIAKLALTSCNIDTPIDVLPDLHLGDTLVIETDICIKKVNAFPQD